MVNKRPRRRGGSLGDSVMPIKGGAANNNISIVLRSSTSMLIKPSSPAAVGTTCSSTGSADFSDPPPKRNSTPTLKRMSTTPIKTTATSSSPDNLLFGTTKPKLKRASTTGSTPNTPASSTSLDLLSRHPLDRVNEDESAAFSLASPSSTFLSLTVLSSMSMEPSVGVLLDDCIQMEETPFLYTQQKMATQHCWLKLDVTEKYKRSDYEQQQQDDDPSMRLDTSTRGDNDDHNNHMNDNSSSRGDRSLRGSFRSNRKRLLIQQHFQQDKGQSYRDEEKPVLELGKLLREGEFTQTYKIHKCKPLHMASPQKEEEASFAKDAEKTFKRRYTLKCLSYDPAILPLVADTSKSSSSGSISMKRRDLSFAGAKRMSRQFSQQIPAKRISRQLSKQLPHFKAEFQQQLQQFQQLSPPKSSHDLLNSPLTPKFTKLQHQQHTQQLLREAMYLSILEHPGILEARVVPKLSAKCVFLVTDRIGQTLEERMLYWRRPRHNRAKKRTAKDRRTKSKGRSLEEAEIYYDYPEDLTALKTNYALQIANALVYLHQRGIVVHNLRPDTLGFLEYPNHHCLKLMDLTAAKELPLMDEEDEEPFLEAVERPMEKAPTPINLKKRFQRSNSQESSNEDEDEDENNNDDDDSTEGKDEVNQDLEADSDHDVNGAALSLSLSCHHSEHVGRHMNRRLSLVASQSASSSRRSLRMPELPPPSPPHQPKQRESRRSVQKMSSLDSISEQPKQERRPSIEHSSHSHRSLPTVPSSSSSLPSIPTMTPSRPSLQNQPRRSSSRQSRRRNASVLSSSTSSLELPPLAPLSKQESPSPSPEQSPSPSSSLPGQPRRQSRKSRASLDSTPPRNLACQETQSLSCISEQPRRQGRLPKESLESALATPPRKLACQETKSLCSLRSAPKNKNATLPASALTTPPRNLACQETKSLCSLRSAPRNKTITTTTTTTTFIVSSDPNALPKPASRRAAPEFAAKLPASTHTAKRTRKQGLLRFPSSRRSVRKRASLLDAYALSNSSLSSMKSLPTNFQLKKALSTSSTTSVTSTSKNITTTTTTTKYITTSSPSAPYERCPTNSTITSVDTHSATSAESTPRSISLTNWSNQTDESKHSGGTNITSTTATNSTSTS